MNPEALCKGSYGTSCRQAKTQDKSHLGVSNLCTGLCYSKDLVNSDKTGLDPILLRLKLESLRYHRSIALNSTNLILFLREKVNEEVGYNSKRGQDRINPPSMTPTGIYDPFSIIDLQILYLS